MNKVCSIPRVPDTHAQRLSTDFSLKDTLSHRNTQVKDEPVELPCLHPGPASTHSGASRGAAGQMGEACVDGAMCTSKVVWPSKLMGMIPV